ncbi:MAG TPA: cytochrome c [Acidobacteriaceae bacterium]|nr:cytochrome c [Acidobacteriaceae bacterium]
MRAKNFVPGLLLAAAIGAASLAAPQGYTQSAPRRAQPQVRQYQAAKTTQVEDEGQRVFEQNCSRCHATPEGFSSRISGTIVRHMRVRANLSEHDEQVLLKYFNQ